MLEIRVNKVDPDESRSDQSGSALILRTNRGSIPVAYHESPQPHGAIVWVWGANGGLDGPAEGIYARLANELTKDGLTSLRVDYRDPRNLMESVMDTLAGVSFLEALGYESIGLVGHSFGGAVVISAAPLNSQVATVVALSSQTYGAQNAGLVSPRPLLLVHGEADRRLPAQCSRNIYLWAKQPKELVLYPGAGHGLRECRTELDTLLKDWLTEKLREE